MTLKHYAVILVGMIAVLPCLAQTTLYSEDFSGQSNKGASGPSPISIDTTGVTWSIDTSNVTLSASDDYMKVVNDSMEFRDVDGPGKWSSPSINIANYNSLTLSIYLSEEGTQAGTDTVSVYYQIDGGNEVLVYKTSDDFTSKTLTDTTLSGTGNSLVIHVYMRNTAGTRYHRIDNVVLKGTTTNNTNSNIIGNNETNYVSTISSLVDTDAEAVPVLNFSVVDSGTSDGLATKITNVKVVPGAGNTADWSDHLQGVKIHDGSSFLTIGSATITDTEINIPVTAGNMDVANNSTQNYTLYAYLNTSNVVDSAHLVFKIDPMAHGFTTDGSGSGIQSTINGGTTINSGINSCYVIPTALKWLTQPVDESINQFMSTQPQIERVDINGNRDLDNTSYITRITSTGTLSGDTVSETASSGVSTFDSLKHTATGTGLQLIALSTDPLIGDTIMSQTFDINSQEGLAIESNNTIYTINFDASINGINNGSFAGSGLSTNPSSGQLNSNGVSVTGMSDGDVLFRSSNTSGDYARGTSTGGVTTGGLYSFEVSSGNNALGFQAIGTDMTPGTITFKFQNHTGDTIKEFLINYTVLVYNDQERSTVGISSYSVDGTSFTDLDTAYTDTVSDSSPKWIKYGFTNDIKNLTLVSDSFLYFRWTFDDNAGSGSRDEIALDDIRVISYKSNKTVVSIPSSIEGEYNTLNINGSGGTVEASGDVTVYNELKLKEGLLNMNGHKLTLGSDDKDCELNDFSESSFVYGGDIRIHVNQSNGNYTFPYGSGPSDYSRANVKFTSATLASTAYLEGNVNEGKYSGFDGNVTSYINRYWTINQTGISNPVYDVALYYQSDDAIGVETDILPVKHSGSAWTAPWEIGNNNVDTVGRGSINTSSDLLSWLAVDGFSVFSGAGNGTPLPVELGDFRGTLNDRHIDLFWTTLSEINSDRFEIQKSINGKFEPIGSLPAAGASNITLDYSFSDFEMNGKPAYYRLKQIDMDGSYSYSRTIIVDRTPIEPSINSEPVFLHKDSKIFLSQLDAGDWSYHVSNPMGQIVAKGEFNVIDQSEHIIDLSESGPGLNILTIEHPTQGKRQFRFVP